MEANSRSECLEDQIREYYGRVAWTHKTHEKQADIYFMWDNRLKWVQLALSAFTTSGVIGVFLSSKDWIPVITAGASTVLFFITAYLKNFDLGQKAQFHSQIATQIWDVRERLMSLMIDYHSGYVDAEEAMKVRNSLHAQLYEIYSKTPRTSKRAYRLATKAIKDLEELTLSEEEINSILPTSLKR